MSKGLEALENLRKELLEVSDYLDEKDVSYLGPIHRIEEELKDYATLYEELGVALSLNECQNVQEWISLMKKKLKTLEIIKNKEIDMAAFNDLPNLEEYNYYCSPELTQEEYDLLREVLLR